MKHKKKKNLIQGYVVEPVIKSLVTNFNHYISRAWDKGPTMQPEYQEKTTDLSEYSQYTDKLYHIQLYRETHMSWIRTRNISVDKHWLHM